MERDLEGKVALVTGASRGIGRGIAERLGAAGALVAVNYAGNAEAAAETVRTIEDGGGQAFAVQAKLSDFPSVQGLLAALDPELEQRTGSNRLDILVNNIGGGDYKGLKDTSIELMEFCFNNNVFAPFYLTQALYDRINDDGRIVNISSSSSRLAHVDTLAYNMAKAALEMFTRTIAKDFGARRITVNSVAPGFTATETNAAILADPEKIKEVEAVTLLGRFADSSDIADFVHALVSPAGRWVTGQNIEASGGLMFR